MSQRLDNHVIHPHVDGDFSTPKSAWKVVKRYRDEMQERKTYQAALNFQEASRRWLMTQRFDLVPREDFDAHQ